MKTKRLQKTSLLCALCILITSIAGTAWFVGAYAVHGQEQTATMAALQQQLQARRPVPFMHRPYYGNRTVLQRTISFVDHDKPWYDDDNVFVRYDGRRFTGSAASVGFCTRGVSCYDGHNGYDLNLWYEPVLSAAAGRVIRANWYNPLDHNSSLGLWVAIDHGNGFVTAYGHLSAITVTVGDVVGTQWQIGTSGTTGASTGPHLHMATYYMPYWLATDPFGWKGNYPDPNTVPDHYLWVDPPGTGYVIPNLSGNAGATYAGATVVDDGSAGWSSSGAWHSAASATGISGRLHWAATTNTGVTATATWHPAIPASGNYEVGVFVDDTYATSSWVPYTVYSADPNRPGVEIHHTVYVDESHIGRFRGPFGVITTGPQWVSIGTYYFRRGMNGRVVISNGTGEVGQQIAADGVEFVPAVVGGLFVGAGSFVGGGGPVGVGSLPAQPLPVPTPVPSTPTALPEALRQGSAHR